jgi:hypothetical protein
MDDTNLPPQQCSRKTTIRVLRLLWLLCMCPRFTICVLILQYVSSYHYVCVLILLNMCPHTTVYLSSIQYYYACVLILLCMCPRAAMYLSTYYYSVVIPLYICPHTTIHVSTFYYMCPRSTICVLILLHMCPHSTMYMCPHTTTVCWLTLFFFAGWSWLTIFFFGLNGFSTHTTCWLTFFFSGWIGGVWWGADYWWLYRGSLFFVSFFFC